MAGVAVEGAQQNLGAFALEHQAAAALVGEGDDAVDVGEAGFDFGLRLVHNELRGGAGAVDGGEDRNVVAGSGAAVGPAVPVEGSAGAGRGLELGVHGSEFVHPGCEVHSEVVAVHVVATANLCRGRPDGLPVLVHRSTGRHIGQRDFVPARHWCGDGEEAAADGQFLPGEQVPQRDGDVVALGHQEHGGARCDAFDV